MSQRAIQGGDGGTVPPSWLEQQLAAGAKARTYFSALGTPEKARFAGHHVERASKQYQPWLSEEERENMLDFFGAMMYGLSLVYVESLEAMAAGEVAP